MAGDALLIVEWADVQERCRAVADVWREAELDGVYGVPRGGCVPAAIIATLLELPLLDAPTAHSLVVDDLIDSGATLDRYFVEAHNIAALYCKVWSPPLSTPHAHDVGDAWIVLPWERREVPLDDAALRLLQVLGYDTSGAEAAEVARALGAALRSLRQLGQPLDGTSS